MGNKHAAVAFGIITAIAVLILAATVWFIGRGLEPILSLAGSIAGVFGIAISAYLLVHNSASESESEPSREQAHPEPRTVPGIATPGGDPPTTEEVFELIKASPEWLDAGTRGFHNGRVAVLRRLRRLVAGHVSECVRVWGYRVFLGIGALAWLWLLLVAVRTIAIFPPIELPAALDTLVTTLGVPIFFLTSVGQGSPPAGQIAAIVVPALIMLAVLGLNWLRTDSTCPYCGEPYALENEGTYYHHNATEDDSYTDDEGNEVSGTKYTGQMLLRCTNKDCGGRELKQTSWSSHDGWL